MTDRASEFKNAAKDILLEPGKKSIEAVIAEWVHGKRTSSTEIDFAKLWDAAKEAFESAFSVGLIFASIRFISGLICAANREPEYYVNIQVAKQIYAEYGDSRWKGVKNLWWRFSILNQANVKLIEAQVIAQKEGAHIDVARIVLLRGVLAQAAGVWSEADKHFERFVMQAQDKIQELEGALIENQKTQTLHDAKLTKFGSELVERLLVDPRVTTAVAEGRLDSLVKIVSPEQKASSRALVANAVTSRVYRTDIGKRIQGLHKFIAYCKYRPTLRDTFDYQLERLQGWACRSRALARLSAPNRDAVIRVLGKMRSQHKEPTVEDIQRNAPQLTGNAG
jgi:hypothetical protein